MYLPEAIECVLRLDCSLTYGGVEYHVGFTTPSRGFITKSQRVLVDRDGDPVILPIEKLVANEWGVTTENPDTLKVIREVTSCNSCINHKPRRRPRG
jgi:hypothetical protein